jgi:hypothetical protein
MEWGITRRETEREGEKRIKGVGGRVQVRIGNGVGWKVTIGKDDLQFDK